MKRSLLSIFATLVLWSPISMANMAGSHMQNFNPTMDGLGYVTVQSAQTLPSGVFNLSFFANNAWNSMPFSKLSGVADGLRYPEPKNKLLSVDLGLALGITESWQVGIGAPIILHQSVGSSGTLGSFSKTGISEFKLHTKYKFWQNESLATAAVASMNFNRINNNPYSGNNPGPTTNLDGVAEYKIDEIQTVATNLGLRFRQRGEVITDTGVTPLSNQLTYSLGYSYLQQPWSTTFIFEVFGGYHFSKSALPMDRKLSSLEALAGAKYNLHHQWNVHGGLTTKLMDGLGNPDFRIYAGLSYQFGPFWAQQAPAPMIAAAPITEPTVIVEEKPTEIIVLSSINFATNSTKMHNSSRIAFEKTLQQMKDNAHTIRKLVIEGHTDSKGSDKFNLKLGQGRAETVRSIILKQLPLKHENVTAVGIGKAQPIAPNDTESGRAKNRRVEIKIYRHQ